jgi:hypothetical protein
MLKQKLELLKKLEQKLGAESKVILFLDVPGPELTPEIERQLVAEARRKNPGASVLFIEWPVPELGAKTKSKRQRKKRGS